MSTIKKLQFASGRDLTAPTDLGIAAVDSADSVFNYSLTASVAANALTIALKTKAASDPSSGDPVTISFRSSTAATGTYSGVTATAATSLVISSGSTLGHVNGVAGYIYVYAINNAGTLVLGASSKRFDDNSIISSTAEGGAGAADSADVMYTTSAVTSKVCRLLGRLTSTQAAAGTYVTAISEIWLGKGYPSSDDVSLTIAGRKIYSHGTTYAGGAAPTITLSGGGGSLSSVDLSHFIPYQMGDSSWRMKFNVIVTLSSTSRTGASLSINGVTFDGSLQQAISGSSSSGNLVAGYATSSLIGVEHSSASTASYKFSGDVKLSSKPTWAY